MEKTWYYVDNGTQIGPLKKEELISKINSETLIWKKDMTEWKKANEVEEFHLLFSQIPPPIPNTTKPNSSEVLDSNKEKTNEKVIELESDDEKKSFLDKQTDSSNNLNEDKLKKIILELNSAWVLLILTLILSYLEYTNNDTGRLYSFLIFSSAASLIRIFIGLKKYLNQIIKINTGNKSISWIIGSIIPIYIFQMIESKIDDISQVNEKGLIILTLILVISLIIYIFNSFKLTKILISLKDSIGEELYVFVGLQVLLIPIVITIDNIFGESTNLTIFYTLLEVIPLIVLIVGIQKISDKHLKKIKK
jgi:hypothetical protein